MRLLVAACAIGSVRLIGSVLLVVAMAAVAAPAQPRLRVSVDGQSYRGLLRLRPSQANPLTLEVSNEGDAPSAVEISVRAPEGWVVEVEPRQLPALSPESTEIGLLTITPNRRTEWRDDQIVIVARGAGVHSGRS